MLFLHPVTGICPLQVLTLLLILTYRRLQQLPNGQVCHCESCVAGFQEADPHGCQAELFLTEGLGGGAPSEAWHD